MRQTSCQCVSINLNYGLLLSVNGWYIIVTPSQCFNVHVGLHWVLPSSTNTTRLSTQISDLQPFGILLRDNQKSVTHLLLSAITTETQCSLIKGRKSQSNQNSF